MGQASASASSSAGINNAGAGTIAHGASPWTLVALVAIAVGLFYYLQKGKH